jgi:hypothetical protein
MKGNMYEKTIGLSLSQLEPLRRLSALALILWFLATAAFAVTETEKKSSPPISTETGLVEVHPILDPADFEKIPPLEVFDIQLIVGYYRKNLADEYFLKGDTSKASEQYSLALDTLRHIRSVGSPTARNVQSLLIADAVYRDALIKAGADFWGGGLTTRPGIPAVHLANMRDLLDDFADVNKELIEAVRKQGDLKVLVPLIRSSSRAAVADLRASIPVADTRRAIEDQYTSRVNTSLAKKGAIEARIKEAVMEREQHIGRADQMAANAGVAISAVVTASLGVDPKFKALVEGKKVESVILSAITDSTLIDSLKADALKQLGDTLEKASGLNKEIAQVKK